MSVAFATESPGANVLTDQDVLDLLDVEGTLRAAEQASADRHAAEVRALQVDLHFAVLHSDAPDHHLTSVGRSTVGGRTKLIQLGGQGTPWVQDLPLCELAVARGVTSDTARRHLADALDLCHRLPRLWAQVQAGHGTVWAARRAAATTRHLSPAAVAAVDAALAGAVHQAPGRFLSILDAEIIRADPDAHDQRDAARRRRRSVVIGRADEHGLRSIFGRIDAGDATWLDAMLDRITTALLARPDLLRDRVAAPDENGNLDRGEVRAEALGWLAHPEDVITLLAGTHPVRENPGPSRITDLTHLAGKTEAHEAHATDGAGEPGPASPAAGGTQSEARHKAVVHVHLAADAITGLLHGYGIARVEELGPYLAAHLARLLGHARIDLTPVIDLAYGRSVNGYEHPPDVKERGHLRTTGDVFPHSRSQSRRLDADHPVPYDPGSPPDGPPPRQTGDHNHAPLTRHHHRAKTHLPYHVQQLDNTTYLWRTPHGLWRLVDHTGTHRPERGQTRT